MSGTGVDYLCIVEMIGVLMAAGLVAGFVVVLALLLVFAYFGVESDLIAHVAIGTSLSTIIVTSARSVYAHHTHGAVDFKIIKDWAPPLIVGVLMGLALARYLDGLSLKWIFYLGVFFMGQHFIAPVLQPRKPIARDMPNGAGRWSIATFLGGFSALLGIGGGTITVLAMMACGRPIHQAVATAAGFGIIIELPGTIGFAMLGQGVLNLPFGSVGNVNLIAVAAITATSFLTALLGAKTAHNLNTKDLKREFGIYLVATSTIVPYNNLTG